MQGEYEKLVDMEIEKVRSCAIHRANGNGFLMPQAR